MHNFFDTTDLKEQPSFSPENHAGVINYRIVDHETGSRHVAVWQGVMDPGADADEHTHADMEQVFYVQEGEILFHVGDEERLMHAEGLVFVPAGVKHWIKAKGSGPVRLLVFTAPAPPQNKIWDKK